MPFIKRLHRCHIWKYASCTVFLFVCFFWWQSGNCSWACCRRRSPRTTCAWCSAPSAPSRSAPSCATPTRSAEVKSAATPTPSSGRLTNCFVPPLGFGSLFFCLCFGRSSPFALVEWSVWFIFSLQCKRKQIWLRVDTPSRSSRSSLRLFLALAVGTAHRTRFWLVRHQHRTWNNEDEKSTKLSPFSFPWPQQMIQIILDGIDRLGLRYPLPPLPPIDCDEWPSGRCGTESWFNQCRYSAVVAVVAAAAAVAAAVGVSKRPHFLGLSFFCSLRSMKSSSFCDWRRRPSFIAFFVSRSFSFSFPLTSVVSSTALRAQYGSIMQIGRSFACLTGLPSFLCLPLVIDPDFSIPSTIQSRRRLRTRRRVS